jgi:hypothetical protein
VGGVELVTTVLDTVLVSALVFKTNPIHSTAIYKGTSMENLFKNFIYAPQESQPSSQMQGSHPQAIQGSVIIMLNNFDLR